MPQYNHLLSTLVDLCLPCFHTQFWLYPCYSEDFRPKALTNHLDGIFSSNVQTARPQTIIEQSRLFDYLGEIWGSHRFNAASIRLYAQT
jgi:hypothetical protein